MKKAIIPAFLLVLGSTVLGATVLQEQLAYRNIKVHEQGTADVNVTNTSLPVAPLEPVTGGSGSVILFCPSDEVLFQFPRAATAIQAAWSEPTGGPVSLRLGAEVVELIGPNETGDRHLFLPLTRPVAFNRIVCFQNGGGIVRVTWIGNEP
jgi:hypothetical protein